MMYRVFLVVMPLVASSTLAGCELFNLGSSEDTVVLDTAAPQKESMVAPDSGWTSLGYLPLPAGILGIDNKATLQLRDLALLPDGSVKVIFDSVTLSQMDPITRVDMGILKDQTWTSDPLISDVTGIVGGEYFSLSGVRVEQPNFTANLNGALHVYDESINATWIDPSVWNYFFGEMSLIGLQRHTVVEGTFYIPYQKVGGVGLNRVAGTTATPEADVAIWTNPQVMARNAIFAGDPAATSYVAYCEIEYGTHAEYLLKTELVLVKRDGGSAGSWSEVARQADVCGLNEYGTEQIGFTVAQDVPQFFYVDEALQQVVVLTPETATTFTKAEIPVPTTGGIRLNVADGRAYVGFPDTTAGGRATIARIDGGALVTVGQPGLTTMAVTDGQTAWETTPELIATKFLGGRVLGVLVNPSGSPFDVALEVVIAD